MESFHIEGQTTIPRNELLMSEATQWINHIFALEDDGNKASLVVKIPFCVQNEKIWYIKPDPKSDAPKTHPILAKEDDFGINRGMVEVIFPNDTLQLFTNDARGREDMTNAYYSGDIFSV